MPSKDCSELARTITELALNIASQPDINTLDDVVAEMQKDVEGIDRGQVVEAINEATRGQKADLDDLALKLNQIKREARGDFALKRKIGSLERTLKSGETLTPKKRIDKSTQAIKDLREIRDGLKKQIAKSEPTQKKRLQAQIETLENKLNTFLESGDPSDILPTAKPAESPKSKELEKLIDKRNDVRREIQSQIAGLKPKTLFQHIQEPFNVARGLMTSWDLSAFRRQGGIFVMSHPILGAKNFGVMLKAFSSKSVQRKVDDEIRSRPNFKKRMMSGDYHAPIDEQVDLTKKEETMQARLLEKLPGIAASQRAFVTFLNKMRADVWDVLHDSLSMDGEVTLEEAEVISNYTKVASGRANLNKKTEQGLAMMNVVFFSPRYAISRFQYIFGLASTLGGSVAGKKKRVRRLIAKEYARYFIGMSVMYALAGLDDEAEVESDPRSSDFGKIRYGNTRLDVLSGIGQATVLLSRLASRKTKSPTSGKITPIFGKDVPFKGDKGTDIIIKFGKYKLSPMFATAANLLDGEDAVGNPFGIKDVPKSLFTPLSVRDIREAIEDQGIARGTALAIQGVIGEGIQTFAVRKSKSTGGSVSTGRTKRPSSSSRTKRKPVSREGR